jgi:hypothetical protein
LPPGHGLVGQRDDAVMRNPRRRQPKPGTIGEKPMKFISLRSVLHALKERRCWAFCAAIATDQPLCVGPNLRILRGAFSD